MKAHDFFHANATIRNRRNSIASLSDSNGNMVFEHSAKASLIWNDFRERMGTTCFEGMQFDLDNLLQHNVDLSSLEMPFSQQEIDDVVRNLPLDKSLGLMVSTMNFSQQEIDDVVRNLPIVK
jgi:hypothetical protein